MQNYYQNTTPRPAQNQPYPQNRNYPPNTQYPPYPPPAPVLTPQQQQKRSLRKASNGLGFFVLVYFLLMQVAAYLTSDLLVRFNAITSENRTSMLFLIQILAGIASALIAAFFYKIISRRKLSSNLTNSRVPMNKLIPMVLLGMGAAMLANQLAAMFDSNISFFELKNSVSMTTSTHSVPEMILYVISTAFMPAFAEELAFRGIFMNVMRKYGDAFAIISSSVLFGAMHGNTTQIVFAFTLGLIFAFVDCKANSIVPSIIIHFLNNFYAVSTDMLSSGAGLDDGTVTIIRISIISMICVIGILSYIYLSQTDKDFFRITESDTEGIAEESFLTLKQKLITCFTSVGVIISLSVFASEMILNLMPEDMLNHLFM